MSPQAPPPRLDGGAVDALAVVVVVVVEELLPVGIVVIVVLVIHLLLLAAEEHRCRRSATGAGEGFLLRSLFFMLLGLLSVDCPPSLHALKSPNRGTFTKLSTSSYYIHILQNLYY